MPIIILVVVLLLISGVRIAQEYQRGVVFRLGRYIGLRGPGIYWIIPLGIERAVTIDLRTRTVSAEQQETITRDSVTIKVNAVLVLLRDADAGDDQAKDDDDDDGHGIGCALLLADDTNYPRGEWRAGKKPRASMRRGPGPSFRLAEGYGAASAL